MERCVLNGLPVGLEIGFLLTVYRGKLAKEIEEDCSNSLPLVAHIMVLCIPKVIEKAKQMEKLCFLNVVLMFIPQAAVVCVRYGSYLRD